MRILMVVIPAVICLLAGWVVCGVKKMEMEQQKHLNDLMRLGEDIEEAHDPMGENYFTLDSIAASSTTAGWYCTDSVTIPLGCISTGTVSTTISWDVPKEPSCKCAYCECTNDHIYGLCDYCGAPLGQGGSN
ncbi:MAG: hypothetical protein J6W09_04400 [Bacteroidales bacterium]|nr:hypothetical protein [Bacteroidales bacterium]